MKILKDEKYVLNIIKFGPILFVIIFAFFITQALIYEKNTNFKKEINLVEKTYLDSNKKRVKNEVERIYREIKEEKKASVELLKEEIKSRVYEAHNVATNIYNDTMLSTDKSYIFSMIKNSLGSIIFNNGRGYFFINDNRGYNLLQPLNKKIENKNLLEVKDVNGYFLVKTMVETINAKTERFDNYYWYKNAKIKKPYKKIVFYKYFEPYDVVIGTGEYTEDFENEIKERLLKRINKIRFDENGYIFILDSKGNALSHYDQTKVGINRLNEKNDKGKYFVKDVIDFAKKNEKGFISYEMKFKPNEKDLYREKNSYVKYYKEWDWVIGTGFYLDNLNKQIKERKLLLNESKNESIKKIIYISILVTIFFGLLSFYISKKITARLVDYKKNLETKVLENLEQKETLLEAQKVARIGNWKWNPVNNICEYSKEVLNILGIEDTNTILTPSSIKDILIKKDISKFESFLENCINTKKQDKETFRITNPNNEIRWVEIRVNLNIKNNIVVGTIQDITDNKNLEIEKKYQEEILYQQSKLAAMGEMLGNIAHQWRQPLSIISTASTGIKLQKQMNTLTDDNFNRTMDSINDSAQYLSQTIEDFKSFFSPKNKISKEFIVSDSINKSLNLISSQFTSKEIEIVKNIEYMNINSYENELIQVLINILNNANDALINLENGKKFIFIDAYLNAGKVVIAIKDNARGIRENILDRIFEPYFTTKHQSQGTGIGLYMSQDIIRKLLEGTIEVKNDIYYYNGVKYKGAKFIIKIPLQKQAS